MQNRIILHVFLFSIVLTSIGALYFLQYANLIFATSPAFVRQEIADSTHDVNYINYCSGTINGIAPNGTIDNFIDISRVTYISDGKFLNATIWLRHGFDGSLFNNEDIRTVSFGMFIDANPDPAIGVGGVGYHKEIVWPPQPIQTVNMQLPLNSNDSWIENIHEAPSYGGLHRFLNIKEQNYTNAFAHQLNTDNSFTYPAYYIPLSTDLSFMSFPERFRVMFYTSVYDNSCGLYGQSNRAVDFTNWVDVPPPKFVMSTVPNSVDLRPDQSRNISTLLKSNTGFVPKVSNFVNIGNQTGIEVKPKGNINFTNELTPTIFLVAVKKNVEPGQYVIPISANVSTGTSMPFEFIQAVNFTNLFGSTEGYKVIYANLTVNVLEPLSFGQWFKEGWDTYGSFISLVGGGFTAGIATLVFDRLKNRKK